HASLGRDDEGVVGRVQESLEISRRATSSSGDEFVYTTLIDTHPTVHPIDIASIPGGLCQKSRNLILRGWMVFFRDIFAMNGVWVWHLAYECKCRCSLVCKNINVMSAPSCRV